VKNIDLEEVLTSNIKPAFLYELVVLLRKKNQVHDAFKALLVLENTQSAFRYKYHNQIEHQKAILFSHDKVKDWDKAIDILRKLYAGSKYHFENPEILTLMASNYKRKLLDNNEGKRRDKDSLDINDFLAPISIYRESYSNRTVDRYYDAINLAYLRKMLHYLEEGEEDILAYLKKLHTEAFKDVKINDEDWWEVATNVEFYALCGQPAIAISKLNDYLEFAKDIQPFELETTLRQLKIYLHFANEDESVRELYNALSENWKAIQQ